jgi:hypothetical protein
MQFERYKYRTFPVINFLAGLKEELAQISNLDVKKLLLLPSAYLYETVQDMQQQSAETGSLQYVIRGYGFPKLYQI